MVTPTQKIQLERLLMTYGKGGSHYTLDNERYITALCLKGKWSVFAQPTESCVEAVERILQTPERQST
jgi:hypothetical protein